VSASIDVVAYSGSDPERTREAQRVARSAVLVRTDSNAPGDEGIEVAWKVAPAEPTHLEASIVIPVFNGVHHTRACMWALEETLPRNFGGEIIVVDDASTDSTPDLLARWVRRDARVKSMRMTRNRGFVECCNRGAAEACCPSLIFLNNDTVPLDGWLEALLTVLQEWGDAGVVGGRLLFPDGSLQEAGGLIFRDGSAAHYGRGDHKLEAPMYNWLREVDYCSGALLATRTELFREIGGFDQAFAPGYYEDVDYCYEVRRRGFRVYYQPEAVVIHVEGATAGTDLTAGMKKHQALNQHRFEERRSDELKHHPARPARFDLGSWLSLGVRGGVPV
jgi:GT2 family glycosyltransferase